MGLGAFTFGAILAVIAVNTVSTDRVMAQETAITTYGLKNSAAPEELSLFSFLVGKWEGIGKTRLADGSYAEFELTWIGRYILDGMAIADEIHSAAPDGSPYLGISIRHFDPENRAWIIEYLNVSNSFLRRQVNSRSGAVELDGGAVVVTAQNQGNISREFYRLSGADRFVYSIDISNDGGQSWDTGSIEMTMTRVD